MVAEVGVCGVCWSTWEVPVEARIQRFDLLPALGPVGLKLYARENEFVVQTGQGRAGVPAVDSDEPLLQVAHSDDADVGVESVVVERRSHQVHSLPVHRPFTAELVQVQKLLCEHLAIDRRGLGYCYRQSGDRLFIAIPVSRKLTLIDTHISVTKPSYDCQRLHYVIRGDNSCCCPLHMVHQSQ